MGLKNKMKQKNKIGYSLFKLSGLLIVLNLIIFATPNKVFAQTACNQSTIAGAQTPQACSSASGIWNNTYGSCSCTLSLGSSCTITNGTAGSNDPCQNSGLTCINGSCALPGTSGSSITNNSGGTTAATPGSCPTGLTLVNGLCLPPNQYTSGAASQKTLTGLLLLIIQFLVDFAGIVAVGILVIGGFWYITSAGNEEQAEKGKKAIINGIIGLVVVTVAYAIVTIISSTLTTTNFLAH